MKLTQNTDTVDIDQKCLGISPIHSGPETVNRGLHIQIRHNANRKTYEKAIEIQRQIVASSELYEAALILEDLMLNHSNNFRMETKDIAIDTLASLMIEKFKNGLNITRGNA